MIFNSIEFLLCFLPVFFLLYWVIADKYKNILLLAGSLVFYSMGDVRCLPVLLVSMVINYFLGRHLRIKVRGRGKNKKKIYIYVRGWLLVSAIALNIGALMLLKSGLVGHGLPLGMSFYTFQVLSYLIDVYRGRIPAERSFLRFAVYSVMFPRIIAGPIVSYDEISRELSGRKLTAAGLQSGLEQFTVGLVLKVLIADRVGILWHDVQVTGFESISTPLAWLAAIAYSLKLYFDFYGYSLMAVGLGKMLGFSLPDNFREPYMAVSVRDFYRRWHITLGRWFCNYVYIPMGGSRAGELRTIVNLFVVWLLTAVWHGYTANFLIWGLLLWGLIVMERLVGKVAGKRRFRVLSHLYLWAVIPVTWMCFVISDLEQLRIYLGRMFGVAPQAVVRAGDWLQALRDYGILLLTAAVACLPFWRKWSGRWKDNLLVKILLAALFWVCVWRIVTEGNNPFLYLRY